jgi:hypothetical protein
MPADMLDRLQESKLRGLEELIDSCQGVAAGGGGQDEAAAIADFMVDEGIGLRQVLMRFWDYYWTAALAGRIPDRQKAGAKIRSFLERGAASLTRAAAVAREGANLSGHEVARLAQFEEQSQGFLLWVQECLARWEMMDRPHKPLDRERVARAQAAFERGECESAADILARLDKGGRVLQE